MAALRRHGLKRTAWLAALVLGGSLAGCNPPPQPIEFAKIENAWPPNNYLVCPIDVCTGTTDATSPGYAMPVGQLEAIADKAIMSQPGTVKLGGDPARHQFIYQQSGLGLADTVWVQYYARTPKRSSLALYSGTGSGLYYDFNTDRERADTWLRAIHDAAGAAVDGD
jgi:hypothetical protein